jgi:hypothetical protein
MRVPSSLLLAGTALVTIATATTILVARLVEQRDESCGVPPGVTDPVVAQHAMACRDLEHGRITLAEYRRLIGLDIPPPPPAPHVQWASAVRAVSSEYTATRWSAQQVLGAPNASEGGDNPNAWASLTADGGPEFIEVGFAQPTRLAGMQIFESYNPGAIRSIELIGASGRRHAVAAIGPMRQLEFACTDEPIVGARITLASDQVSGWNELDAIGAVSCQ